MTAQLSTFNEIGLGERPTNHWIYIYIGIWIYDQPDHVISYPALHIQKSTTNISSTFLNLYYSAGGFENTFCCGIRRPNHLGNEIDWPVLSFRRALLNHYVSLQGCSKMSQLASPVFWSALTMQCWCPSSYLLYSLPFSASLSSSSSSRACMNGACTCFSTSKFNVPDVAVACHTHSNNPKLAKYLTWPTMTCKLHQCREMERSFRHRQIYKEGNLGIDHKSLALEKKKQGTIDFRANHSQPLFLQPFFLPLPSQLRLTFGSSVNFWTSEFFGSQIIHNLSKKNQKQQKKETFKKYMLFLSELESIDLNCLAQKSLP